jgi:3-phytase
VDSVAVWLNQDVQSWLLATAKASHTVLVYNAENGELLREFGKHGTNLGDFNRPNGIAVVDNYVFIVERDNHRVQILSLPSFQPIGTFGSEILKKPYGIAVYSTGDAGVMVYITDNYETSDENNPPLAELSERVHHFRLILGSDKFEVYHIQSFGDTKGMGALKVVESIAVDPENNVLLIADESELNVKIYSLNGQFLEKTMGEGYFKYEPEGIALIRTGESSGYWLIADQDEKDNRFLIFDRQNFRFISAFSCPEIQNTDGITIEQKPFGSFNNGVFFAVHNDGGVGAIKLQNVLQFEFISPNSPDRKFQ